MSGYYLVYCYDLSEDRWTILPPLPVRSFGLGQLNGKLIAVGGERRDRSTSIEVYIFNERLQTWKQTSPPMSTVRKCVNVLSLQSALVVAGGLTPSLSYNIDTVEIFKADTSQWYRTDALLTACCHKSLVAIGNTCYALHGYTDSFLNEVLYASVDDLLGNAVPAAANHADHPQ